VAAERALHTFALALPQHTVVDEDAGELVTDGAMNQSRSDGGVDAAGQTADYLRRSDLLADSFDVVVNE
jgi:hypothetical protein